MGKAPSFQFYPEDWLSSTKLQLCSMTAQGLLVNLICLMHQSEVYGKLLINGSRPAHKLVIKLLRMHYKTFNKALDELILCGVLKIDEDGVIYCKRMIDDNRLRETRRESGKLGGNPDLVKDKDNQKDNQADNQKQTPSSSSSSPSSSSSSKKEDITLLSLFEKVKNKFNSDQLKHEFDFMEYWKEKKPGGVKERWQYEKVFDINRRFRTWLKNNDRFGRFKDKKKSLKMQVHGKKEWDRHYDIEVELDKEAIKKKGNE